MDNGTPASKELLGLSAVGNDTHGATFAALTGASHPLIQNVHRFGHGDSSLQPRVLGLRVLGLRG